MMNNQIRVVSMLLVIVAVVLDDGGLVDGCKSLRHTEFE